MTNQSKLPPPDELASDLMPDEEEFASDLMPDIPDEVAAPAPVSAAAPSRDAAAEAEEQRRRQREMADLERMRAYEEAEKERALAAAAQLQAIIATCLEAAEIANKAAATSAASHRALSAASKDLTATAKKTGRGGGVLIFAGGTLMLLASGMVIAMAIQLQQKVNMADALLVKVGSTALEMKESLSTVSKVGDGMEESANRDERMVEAQAALTAKVEELGKTVAGLKEEADKKSGEMKKVFDDALKTSQKPDPRLTNLLQEVQGVEARVKQQSALLQETSKKIAGLDQQVQSLQKVGGNVERLKSQVEAMVTLERQRYRETLEATAAATAAAAESKKNKEAAVSFPRKPPEGSTPAKSNP